MRQRQRQRQQQQQMREKTSLLALLTRMHKNWVGSSGSISEKEIHSKLQLCVNSLQKHTHCTTHTNTLLLCLRSRASLVYSRSWTPSLLHLSMTTIQDPHNHHHHQVLLLLLLLQLLHHLHHQQHRFAAVKCGAQISLVFSARKCLLPSDQIRTNQIRTWWQ